MEEIRLNSAKATAEYTCKITKELDNIMRNKEMLLERGLQHTLKIYKIASEGAILAISSVGARRALVFLNKSGVVTGYDTKHYNSGIYEKNQDEVLKRFIGTKVVHQALGNDKELDVEWVPFYGFESNYKISKYTGEVINIHTSCFIKQRQRHPTYTPVIEVYDCNRQEGISVARAVIQSVEKRKLPKYAKIIHKDGNVKNNAYSNLMVANETQC